MSRVLREDMSCSCSSNDSAVNRKAQLREGMYRATHFLGDSIKGNAAAFMERQMMDHMKKSVHDTITWVKEAPLSMRQLGFVTGCMLAFGGFVMGIMHFFTLQFLKAMIDLLIFFTGGCACSIEYKDAFLPSTIKEYFKEDMLFVFKPFGRPLIYMFWGVYIFRLDLTMSITGFEAMGLGIAIFCASLIQIYHTFNAEKNIEVMKSHEVNKKVMMAAFDKADKSHDGSLESDEFIQFLKVIDINLNKDDLETILLEVDESHDEKVSFEEFYTWYTRKSEHDHV